MHNLKANRQPEDLTSGCVMRRDSPSNGTHQPSSVAMAPLLVCMLVAACGGGGGDVHADEVGQQSVIQRAVAASISDASVAAPPQDLTYSSIPSDSLPAIASLETAEKSVALTGEPIVAALPSYVLAEQRVGNTIGAPVLPQPMAGNAGALSTDDATTALESEAGTKEQAAVMLSAAPVGSDVISELNANLSIAKQTWNGINCYGRVGNFNKLTDRAIVGSAMADGTTLRFGRTQDPLVPGKNAFVFRVGTEDTLFADSRRCEAVSYATAATAIPKGENFWYTLTLLVKDGGNSSGDGQLITQWHTTGYNPFMGLYLSNGKLRMTVRTSPVRNGTSATVTYSNPWVDQFPVSGKWMTFVFNARVSHLASDLPFLRVWRDGSLIVDYRGPLGYNTNDLPYAKVGFYSWNENNAWDVKTPIRTVYVRKAALVRDTGAKFSAANMKAWAESN